MAEHIGEQGLAVGIAEQVGQVAAGLGQRLLPDRCRLDIEGRRAASEHVLLRSHLAAGEAGGGGFGSCHFRRQKYAYR